MIAATADLQQAAAANAMLRGQSGWRIRLAALVLVAGFLGGCAATDPALDTAALLDSQGKPEESVRLLERALRDAPDNHALRSEYVRRKETLVVALLARADAARSERRFDEAAADYRRVLELDAGNFRAESALRSLDSDRRHARLIAEAEALFAESKFGSAAEKLKPVITENPRNREARYLYRKIDTELARSEAGGSARLRSALDVPVTLEFRDASLRSVLEVVARAAGINIIFDRDVRPDLKTSIFVSNTRVEEALRMILMTSQLDKRVLNENTLVVYPNTPAKAREYQELVVKSFYLANADAKQTINLIRTILKTRDIFADEKLNLVVVRDTPEAVRLVEKLIATHDLPEPEVMLDVEVLEVSRTLLEELGIRFPDQIALGVVPKGTTDLATATGGVVSLSDWRNRDSSMVRIAITDPAIVLNLKKQDGDTNLLANPRIRVKNRDKAKIHIGDRVPVVTTTAAVSGGFVSSNVNYIDVGLKLDVEPQVYLDDEVGIKVGLEVSNIVSEVKTSGGTAGGDTISYRIGTRNASTNLRLRDGETQVLAGLISDEERKNASKVPGLGDLPVVGRLFSSEKDDRAKKEIVLLITPRIVRALEPPGSGVTEFAVGTESNIGSSVPAVRSELSRSAASPIDPARAVAPSREAIPSIRRNPPPGLQPPVAPPADSPMISPGSLPNGS